MILVSHPTVNAFVRALVEALDSNGRLSAFHTTIAVGRRAVSVSRERIHQHPWREVVRLLTQRLGMRHTGAVDRVYRDLDATVAGRLGSETAVYCYEDGALATFRAARERGFVCFYELPIAYFETAQRILRDEALRLPGWAPTLGAPTDGPGKLARKAQELALSDLVICPSAFVQSTLPAGTPSIVAEFGSPAVPPTISPRPPGPLRLLFAGAMSQRKGLADLFAAMRELHRDDVELVVMGAPLAPMDFYREEYPRFRYEPPRPQSAVLELMDRCDALVLPSLVEGRALVQQEALSRGLPLIVTANAGGEDLVVPGETGWLVPIRDPAALAKRIAWLADHRDVLPRMREAARAMAARKTWAGYTRKIMAALDETLRRRSMLGRSA